MSAPVVTFGEIMCRLAPPEHYRLRQTRTFDVTYAGAEASVAASICTMGGTARYVTALPTSANPLAEATMDTLRGVGIDTSYIGARWLARILHAAVSFWSCRWMLWSS
jgi:2-dehydro-3-deoxygluconokinase